MAGQTVGYPAPNIFHNTQNREWTLDRWHNKISDAVAIKTSRFIGRAVAVVVTFVIFIPAIAVDLIYAVKRLLDRTIADLQNMAQNRIPEDNLPWQKYIHDDDVRATMQNYDRFLANHVLHHPDEIPPAAYRQLDMAREGDVPIELITQEAVTTIKLKNKLGDGIDKSYYDIGDDLALVMNDAAHQFYDELMMHTYMKKLGIPAMDIKPAVIRWEFQGVTYTRATHIAPSFSDQTKRLILNICALGSERILELVARLKGIKVLKADQSPFTFKNWDEVLMPLVKDIRTLINHGVSTLLTHPTAILVGKGDKFHTGGHANYEARIFPFDFSHGHIQYDQLPVKRLLSAEEERITLRRYIADVVFVQFDADDCTEPKSMRKDLVDCLTERYLRP